MWTLYDFSASGPGTFTFDPVSRFQVIGFNESVETTSDATRKNVVNGRSFPISITITGVSKREVELKKGDFDVRCSDSGRTSKIVSSILDAAYLASAAVLYIRAHPDDPLYRKYFGGNSPLTVADNYDRILVAVKTDLPMYCSDPSGTCDVIEYDALQKGKEIFYCDRFFGEGPLCGGKGDVQDGTMRGGTTLRMFGYIFAGMGSSGETCSSSQNLPDDKKIKDGVNYEVSTRTLRRLPGACALTWGHGVCSASLPRSTGTPSAKRVMGISEGGGFQMLLLWVVVFGTTASRYCGVRDTLSKRLQTE